MNNSTRNPESSSESLTNTSNPGLKVVIVGGGVGGLTAAIGLRQRGHHVEVYEASSFGKETGAALHTAPNANGILKRLGISCKDTGANVAEKMTEWNNAGEKLKEIDLAAMGKMYEHKWRFAHRVKIHDRLRRAATSEDGVGIPVQLHLSKSVQDVDPVNATLYFKDGTSAQGDVIIGADGVHSVTRTKLPGGNIQPFPSGQSAFRFLIPRHVVLADPRTKRFAENDGDLVGIFGHYRSLIIYPTNDNTILNFACFHPDSETESTESWGSTTELSKLLDVYKEFHPDVLALLEKTDPSSLKVWKVLDMDEVPNWYFERLVVVGDAAHPFQPFLGQGAAIAIEDAVSISILLEAGIHRDEVSERLKLYQEIRKTRAERVQDDTRKSGKSRLEAKTFNIAAALGYCFAHDEWENTTQKLREWKLARNSAAS